jgi:hypothetical protein
VPGGDAIRKTKTALSAIEGQRRACAGLASERNEAAGTPPAALKAERASLAAQSRRIETDAAPIRYVAELIGADADSERAIRWLIALMVLCCDPLAIVLTAAVCQCPAVYRLPDQACRPLSKSQVLAAQIGDRSAAHQFHIAFDF